MPMATENAAAMTAIDYDGRIEAGVVMPGNSARYFTTTVVPTATRL